MSHSRNTNSKSLRGMCVGGKVERLGQPPYLIYPKPSLTRMGRGEGLWGKQSCVCLAFFEEKMLLMVKFLKRGEENA